MHLTSIFPVIQALLYKLTMHNNWLLKEVVFLH